MNYGYIHVSAKGQNEARQLAAMEGRDISPGKPHGLPLPLANVMNDVVPGATPRGHPEIMRHHEGGLMEKSIALCISSAKIETHRQTLAF